LDRDCSVEQIRRQKLAHSCGKAASRAMRHECRLSRVKPLLYVFANPSVRSVEPLANRSANRSRTSSISILNLARAFDRAAFEGGAVPVNVRGPNSLTGPRFIWRPRRESRTVAHTSGFSPPADRPKRTARCARRSPGGGERQHFDGHVGHKLARDRREADDDVRL
jgi:hypothetical protein